MVPRKGFGPFTCSINPDLSLDKNWYILNHCVCATSCRWYLKKIAVEASFQEEFKQVETGSLCLANGSKYHGKASSKFKVVAFLFGLLATLLHQSPDKSSLEKDGTPA